MVHFPVRLVLAMSMVICAAAFAIFAYTDQFWLGLFLRFLIGRKFSFRFYSCTLYCPCLLTHSIFYLISGVTIAIGTLAASIGQITTSFAIQYVSWHWIFLMISLHPI